MTCGNTRDFGRAVPSPETWRSGHFLNGMDAVLLPPSANRRAASTQQRSALLAGKHGNFRENADARHETKQRAAGDGPLNGGPEAWISSVVQNGSCEAPFAEIFAPSMTTD